MDSAWGDDLADPLDMDVNAPAPSAAPVVASSGSRGGARPASRPSQASSQGRSKGLGDAMHEAFTVNTAREVQKNQATDVAAMEARLMLQMQNQHAELMRAQECERPAGRGKGRGKQTLQAVFPYCDVTLASSMMASIKKKGSRSDDGGNVMYNFRKSMVTSEHIRADFTGYVWTDSMIGLATKFVMKNASRVYPADMIKVGYNGLTTEMRLKFDNAIIVPHVMEWRRIHLSDLRTAARKSFFQIEGLEKDHWLDTDFVSDIEHRACEQINKNQDAIKKSYFEPITGWFNKPTFVVFLAKVLQHLQTYSNYGIRDLSVSDIAFHCDAVVQHYVGARLVNR